jgi:hypothetical protein
MVNAQAQRSYKIFQTGIQAGSWVNVAVGKTTAQMNVGKM